MDEIRLGDVLARMRRPLKIDPVAQYRQIGIRSHGRGVFHKEPVSGAALGSKRVFLIEPGDLVVNIVFAWEGAVAVADEGELGMCGSHRFPTFRPIDNGCDVRYIREALLSAGGRELLDRASPGSAGRNRTLNQSVLLDARLGLPSLTEQRQIVDLVDCIDRVALAAASAARASSELAQSLLADALDRAVAGGAPTRELRDLAVGRGLVGGPFGSSLVAKDYVDDGVPVIRGANLSTGTSFVGGDFCLRFSGEGGRASPQSGGSGRSDSDSTRHDRPTGNRPQRQILHLHRLPEPDETARR